MAPQGPTRMCLGGASVIVNFSYQVGMQPLSSEALQVAHQWEFPVRRVSFGEDNLRPWLYLGYLRRVYSANSDLKRCLV